MTLTLYTNSISAHQLPLARELVRLVGAENFRYVYTGESGQKFQQGAASESWILCEGEMDAAARREWLEEVDVMLVGGIRPIDLLERRTRQGLRTYYQTERWFKPLDIGVGRRCGCRIPGWVRLLVPRYWRMARRFAMLMGNPNIVVLPIGVHAAADMARLYRIVHGDPCAWLQVPKLTIERKPFGSVADYPWMKLWGYFVEPSKPKCDGHVRSIEQVNNVNNRSALRILWVGRFLDWKRVDTLIVAVKHVANVTLDLYGAGPEEAWLRKISKDCLRIRFFPPVPIEQVRGIMRSHDLYVLPSSAYEGWGCVVNEALEEEMRVLGTCEAGASATMLPQSCLFRAGDWRALAQKLSSDIPFAGIARWTPIQAAGNLIK